MAHRFIVPDSSPPGSPQPSTPGKPSQLGFSTFGDNNPSTTPAGPPPSSAASFTPAGAPSEAYLSSSIMRGVTGSRTPNYGGLPSGSGGKKLFPGRNSPPANGPLGRSIRGSQRQPSGLSRQFSLGDVDPEDEIEEDAEGEEEESLPQHPGSLFRPSYGGSRHGAADDHTEDQIDRLLEEEMGFYGEENAEDEKYEEEEAEVDRGDDEEPEEDGESAEQSQGGSDADMFLNMRHDDRQYGRPVIGDDDDDLMMLNTPAATNKVRKEAEDLLRRSSAQHGGSTRQKGFEYAAIAKDMYGPLDGARLTEPASIILKTEDLVCRLYSEGVGTEDDEEKMDNSLANITFQLVKLWSEYVEGLPGPEEENMACVGPRPDAGPFEKAVYVANLLLRLHHTRYADDADGERTPPMPDFLIDWLTGSHNPYPDQAVDVLRHTPSPACHSLFWQTVQNSLLRGDVHNASELLKNADWEHVRRGTRRERVYTGQALENVKRFVAATCEILDQCPAQNNDWDIFKSTWTLFRIQAKGALDRMMLFAEGKDQAFRSSADDDFLEQESMSTMARKASSQLPWDVYENLQNIYGILLGDREAIVGTAQDWCEATIGIFAWWDDGNQRHKSLRLTQSQSLRTSPSQFDSPDEYFDRLATSFHMVLQSDLSPNAMNPVEVAVASIFEGNIDAAIGFLRTWSLPVACSVAEVASLGQWLPPTEAARPLPFDTLDMDDLALLNISQPGPDEVLGMKDDTLEKYARELAGIEHLSPQREGWEMAIQVLGRMDLPEKSEEIVGELLKDILETLDENSSSTVDKMWKILNDLGMINYAEETAETFADTLSTESHRYGEALWYYALAHRTDKVREVLNLLISYSLVQSMAYPAEKDLDGELKNLLQRRTETLEKRAKQDLEAAQLLGRMLSGYATLRKFYELRDLQKQEDALPTTKAMTLRKQAAFALVAVISSADDNIRGGLYDETRDAVVSEDFLLALLGEATVFVNQSRPVITLDQIDILLKAIEDIQMVGSRVYNACDDFFSLVLSSTQGLKGSTPADLMKKSTSSLSGSSYVMSGSSMLASHMHKSVSAGGKVERGWDWRRGWNTSTKAEDVLRKLRLGLSKDLARLWLEDADGVAV